MQRRLGIDPGPQGPPEDVPEPSLDVHPTLAWERLRRALHDLPSLDIRRIKGEVGKVALSRSRGSMKGAAHLIGIKRQTLYSWKDRGLL